jgi:hypothetical protein
MMRALVKHLTGLSRLPYSQTRHVQADPEPRSEFVNQAAQL